MAGRNRLDQSTYWWRRFREGVILTDQCARPRARSDGT